MPPTSHRPYRVLCLTGGGIRGILPALWLEHLQDRLPSPIIEHVDLIAGTSTGAILGTALSLGLSPTELVDLYRSDGRRIFPATTARLWDRARRTFTQGISAPKYSGRGLADVLDLRLGAHTPFGSCRRPTLVISYDTINRRPLVFKSWKADHRHLPAARIVHASCAAPTYFPSTILTVNGADLSLIDGGVVANDPTACAIAEAFRLTASLPEPCDLNSLNVITMGTGSLTRAITADQAREWGPLEWAVPVIDVLMDAAADAVDYIASHLLDPARYVRFQTPLQAAFDDMDDASNTNLQALIHTAQAYLETQSGQDALDKAAALLNPA